MGSVGGRGPAAVYINASARATPNAMPSATPNAMPSHAPSPDSGLATLWLAVRARARKPAMGMPGVRSGAGAIAGLDRLVLSLVGARLVAFGVGECGGDGLRAGLLILAAAVATELVSPASYSLVSLLTPLYLAARALLHSSGAGVTWRQLALLLPITVLYIGGPMSLCLHRYFSHRAFQTSRALQLLLAVGATLAYQGGPLWWAAMHVRHHKHCEGPDDPHCVSRQGFWYAWLGWMADARNYAPRRADLATLDPGFARAELRAVQALHPVFPVGLCLLAQHALGHGAMLWGFLLPMLLCRLITCLFNVEFHPARALASAAPCAAINDDRFLAKLVGESQHHDHHSNPRRSRRPDWDLPWWASVAWMQPLGLVWDCR